MSFYTSLSFKSGRENRYQSNIPTNISCQTVMSAVKVKYRMLAQGQPEAPNKSGQEER